VSPVGVLAPHRIPGLPEGTVELTPAGDDEAFAHVLYERLREADRRGLSVLIVVPPADRGIGGAVRDRLRRAAAARP
jgi:L-threonylcarbamoyladenylate synthase